MAFLRSSRVRDAFELTAAAAAVVEPADSPLAGARITPTGVLVIDELFVTRAVADAVPAYRRAKRLIADNVAQLTLRQAQLGGRQLPAIAFLRQPDPSRTKSALLADTVADLADYGVAYWLNPEYDSDAGWRYSKAGTGTRKHRTARHLAVDDVVEAHEDGYTIRVRRPGSDVVDEVEVPAYAVIGFECSAGGWLAAGARAITTARMLEDAARMYAGNPVPTLVLRNTGPRKTPEQVTELLGQLEAARRERSTAYVGRDLELDAFSMNAVDIALSDARGTAVLDIARLTGVPSLYLGQGPNDASMTYSNMTQQRLDLLAAVMPYVTAIAERLSFDDVTGEGATVYFDTEAWLRTDPKLRAELYAALVPIGVMTAEEARLLEPLITSERSSA
jgi:Phage portal protein